MTDDTTPDLPPEIIEMLCHSNPAVIGTVRRDGAPIETSHGWGRFRLRAGGASAGAVRATGSIMAASIATARITNTFPSRRSG